MANFLDTFTAAGLSALVEKVLAFTAGIALLFGGQPLAYDAQSQKANAAIAIAQGASYPITVASGDHAATTTIINQYITQPVIERSEQVFVSGSVDPSIAGRLQALEGVFASRPAAPIPSISLPAFAQSQRIDQLSGTAISNPTITGGSITGASIAGTLTNAINSAIATIADLTSTELVAINATTTNATTTNLYVAGTVNFAAPLSIASGGIGTSTIPSYGQLLLGNSSGGYDLVATSSLGIASNSTWGSITGTLANQTDLHDALSARLSLSSWYATTTDGLQEGAGNLYFTNSRADQRFATNLAATTTTALTEGSHLYFTSDRVAAVFAATTTTAIAEGTNLYWTATRAATNFAQNLAGTTTTALIEGSNLYYTDTRVGSYISGSSTVLHVGGSAYGDIPAWTGSTWNARATSTLGLPTFTDLTSYTPASRSIGTLYPLLGGGDLSGDRTLSLAFGTTTSNTWSGTQTFANLPSLPLTNGYVLRGSGSNVAEATSTLFIANSGNVGIGTTTPGAKMHVHDGNLAVSDHAATSDAYGAVSVTNPADANTYSYFSMTRSGTHVRAIGLNSSNSLIIGTQSPPTATTRTIDGPQLTLTHTGYVGIGVTSPIYQLQLSTDLAGKPSGGSWSASSDERLKTNIVGIGDGLERLLKLQPVSFDWRNPDLHGGATSSAGFIAQNVKSEFPGWVTETPCTGADCDLVGGATTSPAYSLSLPFEFDAMVVSALKNIASVSGAFKSALVAWLSNSANGIDSLFARTFHAHDEVCIGSTCLNEAQLRLLLASVPAFSPTEASISTSSVSATSTPEGTTTTIPTGTIGDLHASTTIPSSDMPLPATMVQ